MSCVEATALVRDGNGLQMVHWREIIPMATESRSQICLTVLGHRIAADSTLQVLALGPVPKGAIVKITATGPDAAEAVASLKEIIERRIGEKGGLQ